MAWLRKEEQLLESNFRRPNMNKLESLLIPIERTDEHHCQKHQSILAFEPKEKVEIVLLGDSLMRRWEDYPQMHPAIFKERITLNCGVGGDTINHVLWRITHGELDGLTPKVWILLIGTNSLSELEDDTIVKGIMMIADILTQQSPDSVLLLHGVFPRNADLTQGDLMPRIKNINAHLGSKSIKGRFINLEQLFLQGSVQVSSTIMPDGLHLNEVGYGLWADQLESIIREVLQGESYVGTSLA